MSKSKIGPFPLRNKKNTVIINFYLCFTVNNLYFVHITFYKNINIYNRYSDIYNFKSTFYQHAGKHFTALPAARVFFKLNLSIIVLIYVSETIFFSNSQFMNIELCLIFIKALKEL